MTNNINVIVADNQPVYVIDCDQKVRIDDENGAHVTTVSNFLLNNIATEQPQLMCESGKTYLVKMLVVITEVT